jgi:hypothetical protein
VYFNQQKFDAAVMAHREAMRLAPLEATYPLHLGNTLFERQQFNHDHPQRRACYGRIAALWSCRFLQDYTEVDSLNCGQAVARRAQAQGRGMGTAPGEGHGTDNGNGRLVRAWGGALVAFGLAATVSATTFDVPGAYPTVAAAVAAANTAGAGPHTVNIAAGTYIDIADVTITNSMTIQGASAKTTTLRAASNSRLFTIGIAGKTVEFKDLTLRDGKPSSGFGGAIRSVQTGGNTLLTLTRCHFTTNTTTATSSDGGAVILQDVTGASSLVVDSCTFPENAAIAKGGGLFYDSPGSVTLKNCTFSRNRCTSTTGGGDGGGAYLRATTLRIYNCTFVANKSITGTAANGGALMVDDSGNMDAAMYNSVFKGNDAVTVPSIFLKNYQAADVFLVTNCVWDTAASFDTIVSVKNCSDMEANNTAALGGAPADNGGPIPTHAITNGSDTYLVDKGSNVGGMAYDQRGVGYDRVVGSSVDIGAFEYGAGAPLPLRGTVLLIR